MPHKTLKVLIPDTVHFHERNFKSLFEFFTRYNIAVTKNNEINSWAGQYGDYSSKLNELAPYLEQLKNVKKNKLLTYCYEGKEIWLIARAELLSWFLPKVEFNLYVKGRNDKEHIELMCSINEDVVRHCFAASMYFLDYWKTKLSTIRVQTHALIFSGSQIYNKSLLEVLKHSLTTPIVMEHFFTGNEYYFEERYTPIPNSSDLRHAYYRQTISSENDRLRIKAINKVLLSNNRNVKKTGEYLKFDFESGKTIGLIGQVANDFSIIETATTYLNSVEFYKEFIDKATSNGLNVVFKAHPWERQKNNIRTSFTKDMIEYWANKELSQAQRQRLIITESIDIDCIFKQSDFVGGLCSQGMLEACFDGFKPVQFGNAFFSGRNFTSDYTSVDDFISDVNGNEISGVLTLNEYKNYEDFLVEALESQLVSVHKSGILSLEKKLKPYPLIPLVDVKAVVPNKKEHKESEPIILGEINTDSVTVKKLNKLKRDPKSFFKDSKLGIFRGISKVL